MQAHQPMSTRSAVCNAIIPFNDGFNHILLHLVCSSKKKGYYRHFLSFYLSKNFCSCSRFFFALLYLSICVWCWRWPNDRYKHETHIDFNAFRKWNALSEIVVTTPKHNAKTANAKRSKEKPRKTIWCDREGEVRPGIRRRTERQRRKGWKGQKFILNLRVNRRTCGGNKCIKQIQANKLCSPR